MSADEPTIPPGGRHPAATDLHDARSRFEQAWRRGDAPALEDFLPGEDDAAFGPLLSELLKMEIERRAARGEKVTAAGYLGRFPAHARVIEDAFGGADPTAPGE